MGTEKNARNLRGFFRRGNLKKSASIFLARIISEKRVLLRAFKIRRGFWARAFQNFSDKKASKTFIFEIEKSEEKKPMVAQVAQKLCKFLHTPTLHGKE